MAYMLLETRAFENNSERMRDILSLISNHFNGGVRNLHDIDC